MVREERVLGGLWGSVVGDALGVPVEFKGRAEVQRDPVCGMRGYGTHQQPAGTWSDDSSLLLCSAESLVECGGYDATDMGRRFVRWGHEAHWTPHGRVFDIGIATSQALSRISSGVPPEEAGGQSEHSNGNGSLMRILPMALRYAEAAPKTLLDRVHRASALTHRHPRSQMACGFFALVVRELLRGTEPAAAYASAVPHFSASYEEPPYEAELPHFRRLIEGKLADLPEEEINSSGYVVHTLEASLWCLLTSRTFQETVLRAVNLGSDTDTTGCVAGGLAGIYHGLGRVPASWVEVLAQRNDVAALCERFVRSLTPQPEHH